MKTPQPSPHHKPAFTLVELLVVIAIIAILATLSSVAAGRIIGNAKKTQAKTALTALQLAVKAYQTEYNVLPSPVEPRPQEDNAGSAYDTSSKAGRDLVDILTAKDVVGNPKGIRCYSPPAPSGRAGYTAARGLIDIWGENGYKVIMDFDGDGKITDPYDSATGEEVHASVLIFCAGPNRHFDTWGNSAQVDDVKSWQ